MIEAEFLQAVPPLWRAGAGFVLGAIAGSFLAALVLRWPKGEAVTRGRSRCDSCGFPLGPLDLVPLLGFAIRRGGCRRCGAAIDRTHPALELGCAAVGGLALAVHPDAAGLAGALFGWMLLALAALDLAHLWLPDRLTVPLAAFGLLAALLPGAPSPLDALTGAALGWLLLAAIALAYRRLRGREGLGGGDSKLLAAIGAWLGWQFLPFVLLLASAAGLAAVAAAAAAGRPPAATDRLPFGAFLAVAAWPLWLARDAIRAFAGF